MKIIHITIHTDCFDRELEYYTSEAGLKIIKDARPARNMVFLADSPDGTMIELLEDMNAGEVGNMSWQIGLQVSDPYAKREEMMAKGYKVGEMRCPDSETRYFFTWDPQGVKIQFINKD